MTTFEFTPTGIEFVHSLLVIAGALAAIAGDAFWMIETNPGKGTESLRRRRGLRQAVSGFRLILR